MKKEKTGTASLERIRQWLPIGISVAALILSLFNTGVSFEQSKLEEIFRPLNFDISRGKQSVNYQIQDSNGAVLREIPGYETNFSCKTGAYREFTQIYYDGTALEMAFADMDVLESGDYVIRSTGQIPSTNDISEGKAYDYCFVRTVAASGQKELWLIYYELDLSENTVRGPFRVSDTILLQLQNQEGASKANMLKNYQKLYELVNALPGS